MRILRIVDTRESLVEIKEVKDFNEAWDYVFDTFGCCYSVEDLGELIEATVYPECVKGLKRI